MGRGTMSSNHRNKLLQLLAPGAALCMLWPVTPVKACSNFFCFPVIDSVTLDSGLTQITINGSNFAPSGSSAPVVVVDGITLTLVSYSNTNIVATFPTLTAGAFLLSVTAGNTTN